MTLEEARKTIAKSEVYVEFRDGYAVVDGHCTLEEIEAIAIVARAELGKGDGQ